MPKKERKKENEFCDDCGSLKRPTEKGLLCPRCNKKYFEGIKKKNKKDRKSRERIPKRDWKRDDKKGFIASWKHRSGVVYGLRQKSSRTENGSKSHYSETLVSPDGKEVVLNDFTRKKLAIRDMRKRVNSSSDTVKLLSKLKK